ncbi:MAG: hypothetical protein D6729_17185 [Deltaproteobacteria bacterium]|nr:MAG: hypothetical protein D6729_17185 [Deltaproteobacteria bacterium]
MRVVRLGILGLVCLTCGLALAKPKARGGALGPARVLRQANRLYEEVEYGKAARRYARVATDPRATPEQKVEALSRRAYCLVALGREAQASDAFLQLLRIQPGWTPPKHLSPKVRAVFDEARRLAQAFAVHLDAQWNAVEGTLDVLVDDPDAQVASVAVRADPVDPAQASPRSAEQVGPGRWRLRLPAGGSTSVLATAYNAYGYPVAQLGNERAPLRLVAPPPPKAAPPPPSPEPTMPDPPPAAGPSPWVYVLGGAGAAALAAGGYFGWRSLSGALRYERDPGSFRDQAEALAFADQVERDAQAANLLYAAGGVLAASALTLWWVEAQDAAPRLQVSLLPVPGGGLAAVGGRW